MVKKKRRRGGSRARSIPIVGLSVGALVLKNLLMGGYGNVPQKVMAGRWGEAVEAIAKNGQAHLLANALAIGGYAMARKFIGSRSGINLLGIARLTL